MKRHSALCLLLLSSVLVWGTANSRSDEPAASAPIRLSVAAAKEQARVMQVIYTATLDAMHHHYFHTNKAILPARAMQDIFEDVAEETHSTARWISVNTRAMSIDNEPKTDFEKQAATELGAGKPKFERVEDGYYRLAAPIRLTSGCVSCHSGNFTAQPKSPRFAGLVISIPVQPE